MAWLKFSGGKGAAVTLGALTILLPIYGYWPGVLIIFGAILIPYGITHNIALAMGITLACLPFVTWLGMNSGIGTTMAVILGLIIGIKFLPTARTAWTEAEKKGDLIFDRQQRANR